MSRSRPGGPGWTGPEELLARVRKEWDSGRLAAAFLSAGLGLADAAEPGPLATAPEPGKAAEPDASPEDPAPATDPGRDPPPASAPPGRAARRPTRFPLRIPLRGPGSAELGERFAESRAWAAALLAGQASPGYAIESRAVEHRQLGRNELPVAAVFASSEDALALAGRLREARRLLALARQIVGRHPALLPWLLRRPLEALDRAEEWPALLGCLDWFRAHPRSGRYLRQVDVPGVHSKFIESRRGLLSELLDLVLEREDAGAEAGPADEGHEGQEGHEGEHPGPAAAGCAVGFARRYGLREKPALVRLRSLDSHIAFGLVAAAPGLSAAADGSVAASAVRGLVAAAGGDVAPPSPLAELALRAEDFAALFDPGRRPCPFAELFVTENEVNYLAFPDRPGAAVVLGSGYGFAALAGAAWLRGLRLRYWGDLDTHGYAILDQFRASFPTAESFLMDRGSLEAHRELWTQEPSPTKAELSRLTAAERELYDALRFDRLGSAVRLEQERIAFSWVERALDEGG